MNRSQPVLPLKSIYNQEIGQIDSNAPATKKKKQNKTRN